MHIDNKTIIDPVETGYEINPTKPVLSFASSIYNGKCDGPHAHPRAQIIYAIGGVMKVITPQHVWLVTPMQAIWVPGMEQHDVVFTDRVEVRNLFLDPSITAELPDAAFAFDVTPFFKELVLKIVALDTSRPFCERSGRLVQVLTDEIATLKPAELNLPVGKDERIQQILDHVIADMRKDISVEAAAKLVHVSERTLSRLFVAETGMSYRDWCLKLKLLEGIRRLQAGDSIAQVSFDLGYESTSAFTYMFRKSLGKPPRVYLRDKNGL